MGFMVEIFWQFENWPKDFLETIGFLKAATNTAPCLAFVFSSIYCHQICTDCVSKQYMHSHECIIDNHSSLKCCVSTKLSIIVHFMKLKVWLDDMPDVTMGYTDFSLYILTFIEYVSKISINFWKFVFQRKTQQNWELTVLIFFNQNNYVIIYFIQ